MSALYQLHDAVTIPEVVKFKHKKRLMVITQKDIQTHYQSVSMSPPVKARLTPFEPSLMSPTGASLAAVWFGLLENVSLVIK